VDLPIDGLYQDAKRLLRGLVNPIWGPIRNELERQRFIRSIGLEPRNHPWEITGFVDYDNWIEDDFEWELGNGLLCAATYGEVSHMWLTPDRFVPYEAQMLRFIDGGGEVRRIFCYAGDLAQPERRWELQRVLLRHMALGLNPRVLSSIDLKHALRKQLQIRCDMFGVLNGQISYFLNFPDPNPPQMLRSKHKDLTARAENEFNQLWAGARTFDAVFGQLPSPPPEVMKKVDNDLFAVRVSAQLPVRQTELPENEGVDRLLDGSLE
jgi:hypothetical protein